MLDAGVPIDRMVAGVAMGLILEPDGSFVVLTDILGSEDALGDMDFKVAGDDNGVTAFQMDIKVEGACFYHTMIRIAFLPWRGVTLCADDHDSNAKGARATRSRGTRGYRKGDFLFMDAFPWLPLGHHHHNSNHISLDDIANARQVSRSRSWQRPWRRPRRGGSTSSTRCGSAARPRGRSCLRTRRGSRS